MITEKEKKEMIEWVSGLTDPETFHHIKILKKPIEGNAFYRAGLSKDERSRIYRDHIEDLKVGKTERIRHLKIFKKPV